jgi:energy-coupling factor transporter ATP-binding protein EcfA2
MTGDASRFRFGLQYLRVGEGSQLNIGGPGTVTVVVGPNNVGKSTLLRQIREILMSAQLERSQSPCVVAEVSSPWSTGTADDLDAWLRATSTVVSTPSGDQVHRPNVQQFPIHAFRDQMLRPATGSLVSWFVNHHTASDSMNAIHPASRPDTPGAPPNSSLQVLHVDAAKFNALADVVERMFGFSLFLDRTSNQFSLRMGEPSVAPYPVDTYNLEYDKAVAALPLVQEQGDGIRAAVGLLLPLFTLPHQLVLIDEPEAYLHPPQARIIGAEIGYQAKNNGKQIIIATHDRSVLQGVIESEASVTVLHLTRDGDAAHAETLDASAVAQLWVDPALRYTNALEGLFHPAVIVAENERDAHFYNAAIDYVWSTRSPKRPAHNLMFLGSNGKTNMARIVDGLCTLGVRVVSCPDLDVLNDEGVLRRLVEAHRGNWTELASDYSRATHQIRQPPPAPAISEVQAAVNKVFSDTPETYLTPLIAEAIRTVTRLPKSSWAQLKSYGTEALRADIEATNRLLNSLDQLRIVTVRVGELENFVTTTNAGKGTEFLSTAFAHGAHTQERAVAQANRLLRAAGVD